MSSSLDKLKALTSRLEGKLEEKGKEKPQPSKPIQVETPSVEKPVIKPVTKVEKHRSVSSAVNCENIREENIARVNTLYEKLKIFEKSPDFEE
ncbi:MAG: hypothetical protein GQ531_00285, partial [Sulfurovum sp.]|nr:hypothetical protein [Sulfurovum sp.]